MLSQASYVKKSHFKTTFSRQKIVNVSNIWWGIFSNFFYPCVMVLSEDTDSLGIQIVLT